MDTDKNELYEILYMLDKVSESFIKEITILKNKLKFSKLRPELRNCSQKFYQEVLVPLFKEKEKISLSDIIEKTKRSENTIKAYLSDLYKHKLVNRIKNDQGDKRTKLYVKMG